MMCESPSLSSIIKLQSFCGLHWICFKAFHGIFYLMCHWNVDVMNHYADNYEIFLSQCQSCLLSHGFYRALTKLCLWTMGDHRILLSSMTHSIFSFYKQAPVPTQDCRGNDQASPGRPPHAQTSCRQAVSATPVARAIALGAETAMSAGFFLCNASVFMWKKYRVSPLQPLSQTNALSRVWSRPAHGKRMHTTQWLKPQVVQLAARQGACLKKGLEQKRGGFLAQGSL